MPRRWPSVRDRKEKATFTPEIVEARLQDFDFPFASETRARDERHEPPYSEERRPTTSDGERYRTRRRPDLTLLIERPKSSDSVLPPTSARRHDSPQIGVAFGSPRHPPHFSEAIATAMSPKHRNHALLFDGPLSCSSAKPKKWKIAGLFKAKGSSQKEPTFYQVQPLDGDVKKLGLPINRNPWRNPKSPLMPQSEMPDREASANGLSGLVEKAKPTVPALEVSIPGSPLERYSVMFEGVNGVKQSALLVRRSKDLESLLLVEHSGQGRGNLDVPHHFRRNTSPTSIEHHSLRPSPNQPAPISKYSLFPITPTFSKSQNQTDSPKNRHSRSATAPAQLSPSQQTFITQKCANNFNSKSLPPIPDAKTSQSSGRFHGARASGQSEIFFEIKSFRDSKGQDGDQFEMTRPPSVVVQVARSKSNARKRLQEKLAARMQNACNSEERAGKTQSAEIDEAIAVVESLTSPSSTASSGGSQKSSKSPTPQRTRETCQSSQSDEESLLLSVQKDKRQTRKAKRGPSKSRLEPPNIDVPSPVLEQSEEPTPKTLQPTLSASSPTMLNTETLHSLIQPSTASTPNPISRVPSPCPSPPPPTPPIKDLKFIPLSKYAPKHTTEDLVRHTGLRPVRPQRSNTDTQIQTTYNPRTSSLRKPERSATIPMPQPKTALPPLVVARPNKNEKSGPQVIAYVKPAAEISIARTVSLSRTPSARVVGPKLPNRNDSRREKEKPTEEVQEKKVALGQPVVQEVAKRHRPGLSQDVVLETATLPPSSPPPPLPCEPSPAPPCGSS